MLGVNWLCGEWLRSIEITSIQWVALMEQNAESDDALYQHGCFTTAFRMAFIVTAFFILLRPLFADPENGGDFRRIKASRVIRRDVNWLTPNPNTLHIHISSGMIFNADKLYSGIILVLILTIGASAAPLKRDVSSLVQLQVAHRSILNKSSSVLAAALHRRQLRCWVPHQKRAQFSLLLQSVMYVSLKYLCAHNNSQNA